MPATRHLDANDPEQVKEAARLLREGGLVAFATETVYGLGANAFSAEAVASVFRAKGRPTWDPLIVHLASLEDVKGIATIPAALESRVGSLMQHFWPGPLTLLLPRRQSLPEAVTAGRDLVGVRVPAHPAAQALLRAAGVPVAAPSANLFGHVSPTTAEHVLADLDGRIDAVLDAGPCDVGVESTVLDPLQSPMVVYRQGAVTSEALQSLTSVAVEVYRPTKTALDDSAEREALPSPGVGLRHYAPRARLILIENGPDLASRTWTHAVEESQHGTAGVLWPGDWPGPEKKVPAVAVQSWGRWTDAASRATALFASLRALDDRGARVIVCPMPPAGGLDDAVRDRLEKAARTE